MRMVPDPRSGRKTKHDHAEVLMCIIAGFLSGHTGIRRSAAWCRRNEGQLKEHLHLRNGTASVSTMSRLLCSIDEELFLYAFMEWAGELTDTRGKHLAIDGKAIRAAVSRQKGEKTPMLLNVIETVTGIIVSQLPIDSKESEIVKIPELLRLLNIEDSVITTDAIGTQTAIMRQIIGQGGHFVMLVKKNQPQSYEELTRQFQAFDEDLAKKRENPSYQYQYPALEKDYDEYRSKEKNRDRYEYRRCCVSTDPECVSKTHKEWPFVKTVGWIRQTRILMIRDKEGNDITPGPEQFAKTGTFRQIPSEGDKEKDTVQTVGIISDLKLSASESAKFRRDHWSVENRLHHVLDDSFREDRSPAKKSRNNLALIRKIAINIIRIAEIRENLRSPTTEIMDLFSDDFGLIKKYLFEGIESID